MFDGLVGRLPIYNKSLGVFGYELNLCSGAAMRRERVDSPEQWAEALMEASRAIALTDLAGNGRALIRVPTEALAVCEELRWPKSQIILGVSNDVLTDSLQEATASRLARGGFTIALHNPDLCAETFERAGTFVSVYAVDAPSLSASPPSLPRRSPPVRQMMVRDLQSPDQYERFTELGFDYYEGRFFQSPRAEQSCEIPGNRLALLELLMRLQSPDMSIGELEVLISRDITLSYKLLRLINSAFYGGGKPVTSIRRAVVFFGLQRIKNWASVILVNAVDYLPKELLVTATIRARACELAAEALERGASEPYYVVGLFSMLDAIMNVPREEILKRLKLAPELSDALSTGEGPIGEVLRGVMACERAEVLPAVFHTLETGSPVRIFTDAIRWGTAFQRALSDG